MKLGFLISFAPFQNQYNILFPPAFSQMSFKKWFPSVLCGQMAVETIDLMVGIQAKTLADALNPQGTSTEDLIIRIIMVIMLFATLSTLLWYFTRMLKQYAQDVRDGRAESHDIDVHARLENIDTAEDESARRRHQVPGRQVSGHLTGHVPHK